MPLHVWAARTAESTKYVLFAVDNTVHAYAADHTSDGIPFGREVRGLPLTLDIELLLPAGAVGQAEPVNHSWRVTTLQEARDICQAARQIVEGYRGMASASGRRGTKTAVPLCAAVTLALPDPIEAATVTAQQLPAPRRTRRALLPGLRG